VTIAELEKAKNDVREKSLKVIEAFKVKIVPVTNEAMDLVRPDEI
jgi:hypothetical protein